MSKTRALALMFAAVTGMSLGASSLPVRISIAPKRATARDRLVQHQMQLNEQSGRFLGSLEQLKQDAGTLILLRDGLSKKEAAEHEERQRLDEISRTILETLSRKD